MLPLTLSQTHFIRDENPAVLMKGKVDPPSLIWGHRFRDTRRYPLIDQGPSRGVGLVFQFPSKCCHLQISNWNLLNVCAPALFIYKCSQISNKPPIRSKGDPPPTSRSDGSNTLGRIAIFIVIVIAVIIRALELCPTVRLGSLLDVDAQPGQRAARTVPFVGTLDGRNGKIRAAQ